MDRPVASIGTVARALDADRAPSSDHDLNPGWQSALPEGRVLRPAAVLVALVPRGLTADIVLTRRAAHLAAHPGQVAFPGGKIDAADDGPVAAALREAEEEIGLSRRHVEVMGMLPAHETVTGYLVTPVVGVVTGRFEPAPEAGEVDEVFGVPLAHLIDPGNYLVHSRVWRGHQRRYWAVPWGPHYIWGATARILKGLADRAVPEGRATPQGGMGRPARP